MHNGVCASESHYYLTFGLTQHIPERATEVIIYVKDGSGNTTSIPDDGLYVRMKYFYRDSGTDQHYSLDVGGADNGQAVDNGTVGLVYKLSEFEFVDENGWVDEIDDSGLTAKIGNNTYHIIGFVGDKGVCGKAAKDDTYYSVNKPTDSTKLCSSGVPSEVTGPHAYTNGSLYRQWTCYGTDDATCEQPIPSAVFNYCHDGSNLNVKYNTYNKASLLSANGVKFRSVHNDYTATYNCNNTNSCAIATDKVNDPKSITYNGAKVGSSIYEVKDGVALILGNYDSSLCPVSYSPCTTLDNVEYAHGWTGPLFPTNEAEVCSSFGARCENGTFYKQGANYAINGWTTCTVTIDTGNACGLAVGYSKPRASPTSLCGNGWTVDGKHLAFTYNDNFKPVYEWYCKKGSYEILCRAPRVDGYPVKIIKDQNGNISVSVTSGEGLPNTQYRVGMNTNCGSFTAGGSELDSEFGPIANQSCITRINSLTFEPATYNGTALYPVFVYSPYSSQTDLFYGLLTTTSSWAYTYNGN